MTQAADALGQRLRPLLPKNIVEKRMFGGLGFMLGGNMAIGTTAAGDLLVRADPALVDELLTRPGAYRMMMGERPMQGFVAVAAEALAGESILRRWVDTGLAYAHTLPERP